MSLPSPSLRIIERAAFVFQRIFQTRIGRKAMHSTAMLKPGFIMLMEELILIGFNQINQNRWTINQAK